MRTLLALGLTLGLASHANDCPYVANEWDEDCYGTLLGPTDWLDNGMVFGNLHRDEWWWGKSEHFFCGQSGYIRADRGLRFRMAGCWRQGVAG